MTKAGKRQEAKGMQAKGMYAKGMYAKGKRNCFRMTRNRALFLFILKITYKNQKKLNTTISIKITLFAR